jgi:N-acetylglucosaminyldiphosphoundecaprenol N-acetyl-beta-D-mannosaminyltransferase
VRHFVDLLTVSLALGAREGVKPHFRGATPGVLQQAARRVLDKYPSIAFAGLRDGYFTREQDADGMAPRANNELPPGRAG